MQKEMKRGTREERWRECFIYRDVRWREDRERRKQHGAGGGGGGGEGEAGEEVNANSSQFLNNKGKDASGEESEVFKDEMYFQVCAL